MIFILQRPIVEFSLENRCVLKAREKRLEKSREKNPLWNKKAASTAVKGGKLFLLKINATDLVVSIPFWLHVYSS